MVPTIIVTICAADPADIGRSPRGIPEITTKSRTARLLLATPSDDGGWLLEIWHEQRGERASIATLAPDTATLAAVVATAVRAIADPNLED